MEKTVLETVERVSKIRGELIWIRAAMLTLAAALFLIFSQLLQMQNSISDLSADFSAFKVHVNHKFDDIETDVSELKAGQQQIVAALQNLETQ